MPDLAPSRAASGPAPSTAVIKVEKVSKFFQTPSQDNLGALVDIDFDVCPGEFVTVVGPSGCGKSTLLKLVAGLSPCSAGRILFQSEEVHGINTKVGYVPQESKLFPWLTVEENVGFGLNPKRYSRADRERQVDYFIKLAGLAGFEKYYPGAAFGRYGQTGFDHPRARLRAAGDLDGRAVRAARRTDPHGAARRTFENLGAKTSDHRFRHP